MHLQGDAACTAITPTIAARTPRAAAATVAAARLSAVGGRLHRDYLGLVRWRADHGAVGVRCRCDCSQPERHLVHHQDLHVLPAGLRLHELGLPVRLPEQQHGLVLVVVSLHLRLLAAVATSAAGAAARAADAAIAATRLPAGRGAVLLHQERHVLHPHHHRDRVRSRRVGARPRRHDGVRILVDQLLLSAWLLLLLDLEPVPTPRRIHRLVQLLGSVFLDEVSPWLKWKIYDVLFALALARLSRHFRAARWLRDVCDAA